MNVVFCRTRNAIILFVFIAIFFIPQSANAACTPSSAQLCAAVDDQATIYLNGALVGSDLGFGYVNWDQTGVYPTCMTLSPAQLALLTPGSNVIAVKLLNTNCCEVWASWTLDIHCADGAHAFVSSNDGVDPISMHREPGPCPIVTPGQSGGYNWYDPLYAPSGWSPPVPVTGQKWGKRLWDPQTGDLLPAEGYSATSPAGANDCQLLFFRQGFSLTEDPTPIPPAFTIVKSASQTTNIDGPGALNFTLKVCNTGGGTFGNPVVVKDSWDSSEWRFNGPYGSVTDPIQGQIDEGNNGQTVSWTFQGGIQHNTCYNLSYSLQADNPTTYCLVWHNNSEIDYLGATKGTSNLTLNNICPAPPTFTFTKTVSPSTVIVMNSTYFFNLQFCVTAGKAWDPTKTLVITDDYSGTGTDDWQFQGPYYIGNPAAGINSISGAQAGKVLTYTITFAKPGFTGCYTIPVQMLKTNNGTLTACAWTNLGKAVFNGGAAMNSNVNLTSSCNSPTYTVTRTRTYTSTPTRTLTPTFTNTQSTPTFTVTFTRTMTRTLTPTPTFTVTQLTPTFTVTFTRTLTPTPTVTFTRTATPTYTITQVTPTFTITFTPSYTATKTMTPTYTRTPSPTPTLTVTFTPTQTVTRTPTPTYTITQVTPTFTITFTPTYTATKTMTPTYTRTPTSTVTITISFTATQTVTRTPTPTYTITNSPTPTFTITFTATYTATKTMTPTYTATPTATITSLNTATVTPTRTPTFTATPTFTVTRSPTPSFTITFTATYTATKTMTPTYTATPTATITSLNTATVTPTRTPTFTATPTYTVTRSPTPSSTITSSPTYTATKTATPTYTASATASVSPSPSNTRTPTQTVTITSLNTATVTRTFTPTFTVTSTFTPTPTFTMTRTATNTYTVTLTPTYTITTLDTSTDTPTRTQTFTKTVTSTYTQTLTYTYTPTLTCTYTLTNTRTYTSTATETSLNSATVTKTASPTFTATRTYTQTVTVTLTLTCTSTPTITVTTPDTPTFTYTKTQTFTRTQTPTFTATNTYTFTQTATDSKTPTLTSTQTNTFTFTNTATDTLTPTDTRTPTPTYTQTNTFTFTNTATYTLTVTDTRTPTPTYTESNTFTYTRTLTSTLTITDTRTPTPTYTESNTFTYTKTLTSTLTITDTRTATPTYTQTDTFTFTKTVTDTRTATPTYTQTNTFTFTKTATETRTSTLTSTFTGTKTITLTPTSTRTYTATRTNTVSFTATRTSTQTNTPSPTPTFTRTNTLTGTPTMTSTDTFTITLTPTNTPLTFPYKMVIEAYNEAGEKVKLIGSAVIDKQVVDYETMVGNTVTSVFNPTESGLNLRFPGIWTGTEINVPYVDFAWDGTNDNGQNAGQGVYYIKALITDEYGHTDTIIKEVQLLRSEEYVRVSIYNEAGELVRRMQQDTVPGTQISLDVDDVFHISGAANNSTTIKLGAAGTMQWDGKNELGQLVSSGMYEVAVEVKDKTGFKTYSTKTITVLNESGGPLIAGLKAYPNPAVFDSLTSPVMHVQWTSAQAGKLIIRFYNAAGELVSTLVTKIENLSVDWNMTAPDGEDLSPGFYAAVIDAVSTSGVTQRTMVKLAIIRK